MLGELVGAPLVVFQHRHGEAWLDGARQVLADAPAAGDEHPAGALFGAAEFRHHVRDVRGRGEEKHVVVRFDDGVILRDDGPVAAKDGGHPRLHVAHVAPQRLPNQRPVAARLHGDELDAAVREIHHPRGARMLQQFRDLLRHHALRVDEHVDGHVFAGEEGLLLVVQMAARLVGIRPDAGDLHGSAEHGVAHLAGHHVHFVVRGHGDEHVGILGAGQIQHVRPRCVAGHRADVEPPPQLGEPRLVGIDEGDVEVFAGEVLGQRAADLPGAEDEDVHRLSMRA